MDLSPEYPGYFKVPGKKHWILLIILCCTILFSSNLFSQEPGEINTLETDNSFSGVWCCVNDGYIYGVGPNQRTSVLRKRENGQSYETRGSVTSVDPGYRIENRIYSTSTPGLIFILVRNDIYQHFLLKSADGGMTFSRVFAFGEDNGPEGTNAADVRLLRGLLELTVDLPGGGGKGTLFIGEYNVNKSRTRGSVNDRVRIMKSADNGDTWTKVVEWNTNGSNQVGHVHAMKQDPYTGEIYVCLGDYETKTGIIKWNGAASWIDNQPLPQTGSMQGFRGFIGLQRYRTCDVLFDQNYFYTFADTQAPNNPVGSESGIWRGRKDFSAYTRVDNQIYGYDPMHIGWFGVKIGNSLIFTTAREYMTGSGWKQLNTQVYISNNGTNWFRTGLLNGRDDGDLTANRYITNVFDYNNRMYIDCSGSAGHSSTIQCSITRKWKTHEEPVILHPVYYVGGWNNSGNDNNNGTNPDSPKLTLANILTNNRISSGARVRISSGTFNEQEIYPLWQNPTFQGSGSVVIEGRGMNETHIVRAAGGTGSFGMYVDPVRTLTNQSTPLILKDLEFYSPEYSGTDHDKYILYISGSFVRTVNCRIGNSSNDDSPLILLNRAGSKYVSENSIHVASSTPGINSEILRISESGTAIQLKNCLIIGGNNSFIIKHPETSFSLKNCTFYGIANNAVTLGTENNRQPLIKNCIFSAGAYPIEDMSGITESEIDYNLYNRENRNVTDGGHGPAVGTSPGFIDPDNGDFNLRSNSSCALRGTPFPDIYCDLLNRSRSNPPSLGAYESLALVVQPEELTVGSRSGSGSEFIVTSNTSWQIGGYDSWLDLSETSGVGSRSIKITATSSNTSEIPRNSRLAVTGQGAEDVHVDVTQAADVPTSEIDTEKFPIIIYPNPVLSKLTIECYDENFCSVFILNSHGSLIKQEKITGKKHQIDFSSFPGGVYILEFVSQGNRTKRFKIIKA